MQRIIFIWALPKDVPARCAMFLVTSAVARRNSRVPAIKQKMPVRTNRLSARTGSRGAAWKRPFIPAMDHHF
jgi:hypothetical protein